MVPRLQPRRPDALKKQVDDSRASASQCASAEEAEPGYTVDAGREPRPWMVDQGSQESGTDVQGQSSKRAARSVSSGRPAHAWHSSRRSELMEDGTVLELLRECADNHCDELYFSMAVAVGVLCVHVTLALGLQEFSSAHSVWISVLAVFVASSTIGAQCAFVLQALNHELGHTLRGLQGHWAFRGALTCAARCLALFGSALCHIPWIAYYHGMGHRSHHLRAGSRNDVDAEALFWLWEPPMTGVFRRAVWLSAAAICVPVAYSYSLIRYAMYDWRRNAIELRLVALDMVVTLAAYRLAGPSGAAYLFLSSSFSMGMFCHPLVGFWILQHLCVDGAQPTVSYSGSRLWNTLCLNELLHVEHHDLAGVGWRNLPKLRAAKPELYEALYVERSIWGLVWTWLTAQAGPHGLTHDFGCRKKWGYARPQTRLKQA